MKRIASILCIMAVSAGFCQARSAKQRKADRVIIDKVASWQVQHHPECRHHNLDWTNGALYRGMFEWAEYTGDQTYFDFLMEIGRKNEWSLLKRVYHADDLCVGQMYTCMFKKYYKPEMLVTLKARMDFIIENPKTVALEHEKVAARDRWSWCDALFMAPPVYVEMYNIFKDEKYLDFLNREYKVTTDSLFNREFNLYYRDRTYKPKKEANGRDVFWGRGNGWVFGGLAIMLEAMPKDLECYKYYLQLFKDMASAVVKCQDENGSWHASMLDPDSYPAAENSASGFFTYGLAWGVNHGILKSPEYKRAAVKGWEALKTFVHEDGFLGNVQPIGAAPGATGPDKTEVYGVGAFLLAGKQMMLM